MDNESAQWELSSRREQVEERSSELNEYKSSEYHCGRHETLTWQMTKTMWILIYSRCFSVINVVIEIRGEVEEPLKWLRAELCSTTEAANPYSCILCKIYLTSLPLKHFHLTLYCSYCEDVRVSHFILLSHARCLFRHAAHTHIQVLSDKLSEWYFCCGWRVEWETVDQTWFKVRTALPYENYLISKLRENPDGYFGTHYSGRAPQRPCHLW